MLEVNNQEGGNGRERERKIRNSYLPSLELIVGLDNGMITLSTAVIFQVSTPENHYQFIERGK